MRRQQRSFYDDWVRGAREAGLPEDEIQAAVDAEIRDAVERAAGRCPRCAAPIRSAADPRQFGPPAGTKPGGAWIMYWCSRDIEPGTHREQDVCGYRVDFYEES